MQIEKTNQRLSGPEKTSFANSFENIRQTSQNQTNSASMDPINANTSSESDDSSASDNVSPEPHEKREIIHQNEQHFESPRATQDHPHDLNSPLSQSMLTAQIRSQTQLAAVEDRGPNDAQTSAELLIRQRYNSSSNNNQNDIFRTINKQTEPTNRSNLQSMQQRNGSDQQQNPQQEQSIDYDDHQIVHQQQIQRDPARNLQEPISFRSHGQVNQPQQTQQWQHQASTEQQNEVAQTDAQAASMREPIQLADREHMMRDAEELSSHHHHYDDVFKTIGTRSPEFMNNNKDMKRSGDFDEIVPELPIMTHNDSGKEEQMKLSILSHEQARANQIPQNRNGNQNQGFEIPSKKQRYEQEDNMLQNQQVTQVDSMEHLPDQDTAQHSAPLQSDGFILKKLIMQQNNALDNAAAHLSNSHNFSDSRAAANQARDQNFIMRQTAPSEMVLGSLHYVHDLASFDQVRRNQTRERDAAGGVIQNNLGATQNGLRAIPLTAGQVGQLVSNADLLNSQIMNSTLNNNYSRISNTDQRRSSVDGVTGVDHYHQDRNQKGNKLGRALHARGNRGGQNEGAVNHVYQGAPFTDDSGYHAGEISFRGSQSNSNQDNHYEANQNQYDTAGLLDWEDVHEEDEDDENEDSEEYYYEQQDEGEYDEANYEQYIDEDGNLHTIQPAVAAGYSFQQNTVSRVTNEGEKHSSKVGQHSNAIERTVASNSSLVKDYMDRKEDQKHSSYLSKSVDPAVQIREISDLTDRDIAKNNLISEHNTGQDNHDDKQSHSSATSETVKISNLSKTQIHLQTKTNPSSKLGESYAPGSIKRMRKSAIETYATTQKLPSSMAAQKASYGRRGGSLEEDASRALSHLQIRTLENQRDTVCNKQILSPIRREKEQDEVTIITEGDSLSIRQDHAGDYVESSFASRQRLKSREFAIKRIKYVNPSALGKKKHDQTRPIKMDQQRPFKTISQAPSLRRIQPNPSTKELNDMYLPQHAEVGGEDWFTKIQLRSTNKQKLDRSVNSIIGGVETRSILQQSNSRLKLIKKPQRMSNSLERPTPSITQNLSLVQSLNERLARRKQDKTNKSLRINQKLFI